MKTPLLLSITHCQLTLSLPQLSGKVHVSGLSALRNLCLPGMSTVISCLSLVPYIP